MRHERFLWVGLISLVVFAGIVGNTLQAQVAKDNEGVSPEKVAEYIHSVIEADRTLYTEHVVQRMAESETVKAMENWKSQKALPLPAQMLALSGLRVKGQSDGLQYRLISLWPIYEKNRPSTEFERTGLETVAGDPSRPYNQITTKDGRRYFTAIYADKAVSQACVSCHNEHALSPKRDYTLNDVMGGVVISFPIS